MDGGKDLLYSAKEYSSLEEYCEVYKCYGQSP